MTKTESKPCPAIKKCATEAFQAAIAAALRRGGYEVTEMSLGQRPGGSRANRYPVALKHGERIAVSLKVQDGPGSAEQKIPFEVMCLTKFVDEKACDKALLVLAGDGWTLRDYYIHGDLRRYLRCPDGVNVTRFEDFLMRAENGEL